MKDDVKRIMRVVRGDATGAIERTVRVAESDMASLLKEFMDVKRMSASVTGEDGNYRLLIDVDVARFYGVGNTDGE